MNTCSVKLSAPPLWWWCKSIIVATKKLKIGFVVYTIGKVLSKSYKGKYIAHISIHINNTLKWKCLLKDDIARELGKQK